jgi:hypothetical protein
MNENLHKLRAGLLSLVVVGGVTGLLTMSLASTQPTSLDDMQPKSLASTQTATVVGQNAIETIVVIGHRPAKYAAVRLGGSNDVVLK